MSKNVTVIVVVIAAVVVVAWVKSSREPTEGEPTSAPASQPAEPLPSMVDLGAHECIACKEMAPILKELRAEYAGRADIIFIDVWKNPSAKKLYGIRSIPTQIFFDRDGEEVWRHEGFLAKDKIVAKLAELGAK
jgi:thioredoxin 1